MRRLAAGAGPHGLIWKLPLRFFDQIRVYPMSEAELAQIRRDFPVGRHRLRTEAGTFSLRGDRQWRGAGPISLKSADLLRIWASQIHEPQDVQHNGGPKNKAELLLCRLVPEHLLGEQRPRPAAKECQHMKRLLGGSPSPISGG